MSGANESARSFISLQRAAVQYDLSTDYLRDLIARGVLPGYRIGQGRGLIRIRVTDLNALLRRIPTTGGAL